MTQKEELATLQAENIDLKNQLKAKEGVDAQLTEANTKLAAAEKARDEEKSRADKAESEFKAATTRAEGAEKERDEQKAAAEKASKEAGEAKANEQKTREQLASRNINPKTAQKDPKTVAEGNVSAEDLRAQLAAATDPEEKFRLSQQIRELEKPAKR